MASTSGRRLYALLALLGCVLLVTSPAQEKRLSIYGPHASYSIVVSEHEGKEDYVAIADTLQPLGVVAVKIEGKILKVSFTPAGAAKAVELQFADGQTRARLRGADMELASRFLMEGSRGMVPVRSLPQLLARILATQIDFHERGRRLFIGNSGVHYSAELKTAPTRLVLSFSAPVNPSIATEPGGLHMVFTRDAVVTASALQPLDNHTITAVNFSEANGTAELSVAANAPLVPKFGDGGRTITITPAATSAAPATAAQLPAVPALPQPTPVVPQRPKFLVMIDPGHGGTESGAALGDMAEKDFNLSTARRLRAELEGRGINTALLRDGDIALSLDQRALSTNAAHAGLYIAIHASPTGTGVRVYTSDLAHAANSRHVFLSFDSAQAAYVDRASLLAGNIVAELAKRQVGAASLPAPVRPLNSVAAPAIALEIAPPQNDIQGFSSSAYQQSICSALGAAVEAARARLERPR